MSVDVMMRRILDRHPAAAAHDPCPCGITFAVIPAELVQGPHLHFPIFDDELRDEAVRFLRDNNLPYGAYAGGVLVIAEVA